MDSFGKALGAGDGCKVVNMISGAAITAKKLVAVDPAAVKPYQVIMSTAAYQAIGVALEAATGAGQVIQVAVAGKVEDVLTDGSVAVGDRLIGDANSVCNTYTAAATTMPFGIALETDDATPDADIWIFDLGFTNVGV